MHKQLLSKKFWSAIVLIFILNLAVGVAFANQEDLSIDRIDLVTQQINLLKNRYSQAQQELSQLQQQHDSQISQLAIEKASKTILDKTSLAISVTKSNLDSINIEVSDTQQTINWLEKSIQEIENQLNVLGMFGLKISRKDVVNVDELKSDLDYQKKLIDLEKSRMKYLQNLQTTTADILQFRVDHYNRINTLLKSHTLLYIKQQQVQDELAYQQTQNYWLQQVNLLTTKLTKLDPNEPKSAYSEIERQIFYANENANFAYDQSLIARYKDQIQQMNLSVSKGNSISLLNEMSDQVQTLNAQIDRLKVLMKSRITLLSKHTAYLSQKKRSDSKFQKYIGNLNALATKYQSSDQVLDKLHDQLLKFRSTLDQAIQSELSARQGFPTFDIKSALDIGKEMLLVPELTFQVTKNLSEYLVRELKETSVLGWALCLFLESLFLFAFFFVRKVLKYLINKPSSWREQLNSKWLSVKSLYNNSIDLMIVANIIGLLSFFSVPSQSFYMILYLATVWLTFKLIMTVLRLCLVESTMNSAGHDVRLYNRLKWIIFAGALITGITVFIHQLPLLYEIKMLCDRMFLFFLMIVSILLLRSWDVVPNIIISQLQSNNTYVNKSICLVGILIPLLLLGNSIIGLVGFLNLVMTVTWYEGVFLLVLIGYLILRGLLSDGMEQVSRLMIQYVNNGWLWTEAFLKPLDKVLRITLFLVSWAVLFLLYGWDKQSPIVERFARLLQYHLASVLNTTITPMNIIELCVVISVFYWTAKWTREFVYRMLERRTKDMGIRNSIAILSQYSVVVLGAFLCLRVLGIDLRALAAITAMFALGVGMGLRDLANNFACGFLILLERPLRVGDIVNINGFEGEVTNIGSRAVTVRTWDFMEVLVPNTEIFNKSFTNWTAKDNIVRSVVNVVISRYDNPHEIKIIIQHVLNNHKDLLKDPMPEAFLKEMSDSTMNFEVRYFVNIRQVKSRVGVMSSVLMGIWDAFAQHGIKPPSPQHEVFIKNESAALSLLPANKDVI